MTDCEGRLVREHWNFTLSIARRFQRTAPDRWKDDIESAALYGLLQALRAYDETRGTLKALIATCVRRCIYAFLNRDFDRWMTEEVIEGKSEDEEDEGLLFEKLTAATSVPYLETIILNDALREYPELRMSVAGYDGKEIAEKIGVHQSTVNRRLIRIRKHLQELLDYKNEEGTTERSCNACKTKKSSDEFYRDARNSDGRMTICIECFRHRRKHGGSDWTPRKVTDEMREEMAALLEQGMAYKQIAKKYGLATSTVRRNLKGIQI